MKDDLNAYELILETHNEGDRVLIKSILDAEGIQYYIQGEHVAPYYYHAVPMRLMVIKDQAEEAREILKDFEPSFLYGRLNNIEDIADDKYSR